MGALCPLRPSRPASDAPPWSAPVGQNFSRKTRIHGKEEEGHRPDQASDRSRCSHPRTPRRPRTGPARREHHRVTKAYNAATESQRGSIIPVEITVYEDRTFTFVLKTPPAAELIKKAAGVQKGSGTPNTAKVGSITMAQAREIGEAKMADLNANDADAAAKIIAGTARSMGITVED